MSQLVSFIVSVVLARLLSPRQYGIIALVNVFIIIAGVFVTSGFNTSLIQKKDADDLDFSTIFHCSFVFSGFLYLVLFLCAPLIAEFYHNSGLTSVVRVLSLVLPVLSFNSIQQAYVARKLAFRKIFLSTTIATIFSGIIGILLAYFGLGVWSLVFQYLSNNIFATIVLFLQIPWRPHLMFSAKRAKSLLGYGWKVMAADFLGTFFGQLRSLVIGRFYAPSNLAFYNRGQQLPTLVSNNIDTTISSVLFPYMSQVSGKPKELKRVVRRSLRTSSYLIMPMMFGLAATSKPLIILLLTQKWLPAVPIMRWLSIACAFSTITNANLQVMKASGRSDILLKIELIKKPVYVVLLFLSIKLGILAVAITMLIYSIYATLVNMGPNKKIIGYTYCEQFCDIFPSFILSLIMFIIVMPIEFLHLPSLLTLIFQIVLGTFLYVLGSLVFKIDAFNYLLNKIKK